MEFITTREQGLTAKQYRRYLKRKHWQKFRLRALKRANNQCERIIGLIRCSNKTNLDVHHLNYKRLGKEKLDDVEVICRNHHELVHPTKLSQFEIDVKSIGSPRVLVENEIKRLENERDKIPLSKYYNGKIVGRNDTLINNYNIRIKRLQCLLLKKS